MFFHGHWRGNVKMTPDTCIVENCKEKVFYSIWKRTGKVRISLAVCYDHKFELGDAI